MTADSRRGRLWRGAALALGVGFIANGLYMFVGPFGWYLQVPGVVDTGPPNRHFIGDIGGAYLATGAGLLAGLRFRAVLPGAALVAALFHGLHAVVHVLDAAAGRCTPRQLMLDPWAVGLPALVLAGFAVAILRGRA